MRVLEFLTGTGGRLALATTLICGATLGTLVSEDDSSNYAPPAVSVPAYTSAPAAQQSSASSSTGSGMPVVAHTTMADTHAGSGASTPSASSSSSSSSSFGSSFSSGGWSGGALPTTRVVSGAASGGGGGGGASASGSTSSGGSSSAGLSPIAFAPRQSIGSGFAMSMPMFSPRQSPLQDQLALYTLYTGDEPGEITGDENSTLDDSIISCYGLPIGDGVWVMLLMAMVYSMYVFIGKLSRQR